MHRRGLNLYLIVNLIYPPIMCVYLLSAYKMYIKFYLYSNTYCHTFSHVVLPAYYLLLCIKHLA